MPGVPEVVEGLILWKFHPNQGPKFSPLEMMIDYVIWVFLRLRVHPNHPFWIISFFWGFPILRHITYPYTLVDTGWYLLVVSKLFFNFADPTYWDDGSDEHIFGMGQRVPPTMYRSQWVKQWWLTVGYQAATVVDWIYSARSNHGAWPCDMLAHIRWCGCHVDHVFWSSILDDIINMLCLERSLQEWWPFPLKW